jgi:hypothetical protein
MTRIRDFQGHLRPFFFFRCSHLFLLIPQPEVEAPFPQESQHGHLFAAFF